MSLHQSSGRWRLGLALSLLTAFLWGILPIALKVALQALDVYTLTWFRFIVAFGLLIMYLGTRQNLPKRQTLRSMSFGLMAIAIFFLAINYVLFVQGLALTSPANAQVLIQLAPVSMGVGALIVFKERYTRLQWTGMTILCLGLVTFFHEQLRTLLTNPGEYLIGSALLVIAAVTWAVYALAQKQLLQKLSSSATMLIIYGGCALLFSPFIAPQQFLALNPFYLAILLFCALNTLVAYGAFAEALAHWEASRVSAVLALTPIITLISTTVVPLLWPTLIAPERFTIWGMLGAVFVVVGSCTVALGRERLKRQSPV